MCAVNPEPVKIKSAIAYKYGLKKDKDLYSGFYKCETIHYIKGVKHQCLYPDGAYYTGFHAFQFEDHAREEIKISIRITTYSVSTIVLLKVQLENIVTIGLDGSRYSTYLTPETRRTFANLDNRDINQYPIYIAEYQTILEELEV